MTKRILFTMVIILLFIPMVQQWTASVELKPLGGSFEKVERPELSAEDWFEGQYQNQLDTFLNQNVGFRSFFVRLYNQIHFSLFKQARASWVVVGKNDYLYEEMYIDSYLGRDFIGAEEIAEKAQKLKKINDTLSAKNIDLIVLLAPGKGSFYPEYIPDRYRPQEITATNYEVYKEEISKTGVHLLDFNSWFKAMKGKSDYRLFPKTGVHWSKYGQLLVVDSIAKYINKNMMFKKVPTLQIGAVEESAIMRGADDDIEQGMNLLFEIEDIPMGYAEYKIVKDSSANSKVLTVADSYYWGLFDIGCSRDVFNNGKYWFYNEQIYPDTYTSTSLVRDIDIIEEVEKNDVILLLSTDANLYRFAFGFIDQLYDAYFISTREKVLKEKKIQTYIQAIKENPEWYESIKKKASREKITVEKAIRQDAEYLFQQEQ